MSIVPEQVRMIEANAALAIEELSALSERQLRLRRGIGRLGRRLHRAPARASSAPRRAAASSTCSAAISARRSSPPPGRAWDTDDSGNLGIAFANGDMAYPFTKVGKQLEQGLEGGEFDPQLLQRLRRPHRHRAICIERPTSEAS